MPNLCLTTTRVFLDTSFAIALSSATDQNHLRAVQLANQIETNRTRLEEQGHTNNTILSIDGDYSQEFGISWTKATDISRAFHKDEQVAVEFGAYGISALIVPKLTNLTVIERSKKGTGFDFWLGSIDNKEPLFQNKARLEVSGIAKGTKGNIKSRLNTKLKQITPSDGTLPGYVSIVEFSSPCSRVVQKCEK